MKRLIQTLGLALAAAWPLGALAQDAQPSWVELAVNNFGAPINTLWAEGELTFADDGTMVYCSAREDMSVAPGDPKDLYIATFNAGTGTWNEPRNMGIPINAAPATDVDPLRRGDDREPWITADGNTIYFKSDRLATTAPRNNNDLFVTRMQLGPNEWGPAHNLGPQVNTASADMCPALPPGGGGFAWFSSHQDNSLGDIDIFWTNKVNVQQNAR